MLTSVAMAKFMVDAVLESGDRDLGGQRYAETAGGHHRDAHDAEVLHLPTLAFLDPDHALEALASAALAEVRSSVTPSTAKRGPTGPMTPSSATWVTIAIHGCGPLWLDRPGWPY
ncbi:hypothetical protein [Achromobacter xylosoxidans]|uniref:hypothetical protein n=1 Tax=Alcaligenes xylosoxydans xylosoxydans TaxID=85698 RepID=UPI0011D24ED3|nr:hypothetical protein [Achromobacter xylosoxidans]